MSLRRGACGAHPLCRIVVGEMYEGTIVGVANYGAFVDIGAVSDGLVHISELSDRFITDVASIVSVGDAVSVRVMSCDESKKQLSLSMKPEGSAAASAPQGGRSARSPRAGGGKAAKIEALKAYVGADASAFIEGVVSNVQSWGAFVTVADGVDGLVHISRVADERTEDLASVLSEGQAVKVRVVDVDLEKGTLALAMDTYRERAERGGGSYDGGAEGSGDGRRSPRFKSSGGEDDGSDQDQDNRPRMSRAEPGDDMWDTKPNESFDWRAAMVIAQGEASEDDDAGFKVDARGMLVLN
ncbi:hypothetical protein M885DRAFT_454692 [Pelagophyceae sp. CCMP2097]|nr:hypothetical protein M885DRAFT_454692 [Pelagophyceae sp. CCMP2097]